MPAKSHEREKDSELGKRSLTEREREQKMLRRRLLWGDDTTSSLYGWERDYKSNENTIYSKRSKSVWLIKTRWRRREERKVHERDFLLKQMRTLFLFLPLLEREKFAHKITAIVVRLSFSLSPLLHIRLFAFLYNKRRCESGDGESRTQAREWISDFFFCLQQRESERKKKASNENRSRFSFHWRTNDERAMERFPVPPVEKWKQNNIDRLFDMQEQGEHHRRRRETEMSSLLVVVSRCQSRPRIFITISIDKVMWRIDIMHT